MPLGLRRVGLPVSQSTEGKDAKTLPTTNNPLLCKTSLALSRSRGSGEAEVKGVIHPFIASAYPPGNVVFILMDDVNGSIRRTAIDDDIFKIRVALINDGADGLLNGANSVIYRGDALQIGLKPAYYYHLVNYILG